MKMNTIVLFAGFGLMAGMSANVESHQAAEASTSAQSTASISVATLQSAEQVRRTGDFLLAPVKSRFDLINYVHAIPHSPLDRLSPSAKQRFLASLTFNESGLTGFDYSDLRAELTVTEVYQVLSIFGAQRLTSMVRGARVLTATDKALQVSPSPMGGGSIGMPDDHEGYVCQGAHTCAKRDEHICMTGC
ncbi:hypothetical protein [Rhodanobacter sp. C05]|uniref:hypothetical protein n=1 Tax=Rhodanobacter sp. C05 TaxID=1945855 RepID=UPI00117A05CF|nr:hypothetical protein [Rhodanobacter sp. C05]